MLRANEEVKFTENKMTETHVSECNKESNKNPQKTKKKCSKLPKAKKMLILGLILKISILTTAEVTLMKLKLELIILNIPRWNDLNYSLPTTSYN